MDDDDLPVARVPIEDTIDLHSFSPADIPIVVEEYLLAARAAGFSTVRLIHGRGQGVQKARVTSLLEKIPGVRSAHEAPADLGGWGATIVDLLPPEKPHHLD